MRVQLAQNAPINKLRSKAMDMTGVNFFDSTDHIQEAEKFNNGDDIYKDLT